MLRAGVWCFGVWVAAGVMVAHAATPVGPDDKSYVHVRPPDATIIDIDTGQPVPRDKTGHFPFPLPTPVLTPHHWDIIRPPFGTAVVTLVWDKQWTMLPAEPAPDILDNSVIRLNRTIALNVSPGDFHVYVEAPTGPTSIFLEGQTVKAVELPRTANGVTVPHAWDAPDLLLTCSGYKPFRLQIPRGALGGDLQWYPSQRIDLVPRYGWFTDLRFDVGLALGVAALAWVWSKRRQVVA